jgi:hypothetical protein
MSKIMPLKVIEISHKREIKISCKNGPKLILKIINSIRILIIIYKYYKNNMK